MPNTQRVARILELSPLQAAEAELSIHLDHAISLADRNHKPISQMRLRLALAMLSLEYEHLLELYSSDLLGDIESLFVGLVPIGPEDSGVYCHVCDAEAHNADCPLRRTLKLAAETFFPKGGAK